MLVINFFLEKDYSSRFSSNIFTVVVDATAFPCNRYQNMVHV
jgi:hypothetical protein